MWENAYLSIKNPKASRARLRALDPGRKVARFATSATFGLRTWGPPLDQILDPHLPFNIHHLFYLFGITLGPGTFIFTIVPRRNVQEWSETGKKIVPVPFPLPVQVPFLCRVNKPLQ